MKGFPFPSGWNKESMRGRELERVERGFLLATGLSVWCSQDNEIRGRLLGGVLSFFWVCEPVDLRGRLKGAS